eukprot:m.151869 g.151869  ORF g.151869 m.151869 type:complete len:277 (+) comp17875_c0_seq3:311-1141(+)
MEKVPPKAKRKQRKKPYVSVSERIAQSKGDSTISARTTSPAQKSDSTSAKKNHTRTPSKKPKAQKDDKPASNTVASDVAEHPRSSAKSNHKIIDEPKVIALSKKGINDVPPKTLQPNAKAYGGMGLARPTRWLQLRDRDLFEKFSAVFSEHINGFSGKAFAKARKREMNKDMLWRVKLREKYNDKGTGEPSALPARMASAPKATALVAGKRQKSKQWIDKAIADSRANIPKVNLVTSGERQRAIDRYREQQRMRKHVKTAAAARDGNSIVATGGWR